MSQSPSGAEKNERRRNLRGRMVVRVRYVSGGRIRHSYAEDLSTGGLFIVSDDPPPLGAHVELFFIPPKSNITIHVLAEVRWIRPFVEDAENEPPGMGVAFIGRAPNEKKPRAAAKAPQRRQVDYDLFEAEAKGQPARPSAAPPSKRAPAGKTTPGSARDNSGDEPDWAQAMARRSVLAGPSSTNAEFGGEMGVDLDNDTDEPLLFESRPKVKVPPPKTPIPKTPAPSQVPPPVPKPAAVSQTPVPAPSAKRKAAAPPPSPAAIAKRRTARVRMELQIDLKTESNFYVGFTENIGSGGVFVATYDMLPVDTDVLLTFTLPNREDAFLVPGRVRWTRPFDPLASDSVHPGLGVAFSDLPSEDSAAITYFIRKIRDPYFIPTEDN